MVPKETKPHENGGRKRPPYTGIYRQQKGGKHTSYNRFFLCGLCGSKEIVNDPLHMPLSGISRMPYLPLRGR